MIEAILLAAGSSRRFGDSNKLLMDVSGRSLIRHVFDQIEMSGVGRIIVVLGKESERIISELPIEISNSVFNEAFQEGKAQSIRKGLSKLSSDCNAFMICLSDMPLLTSEHYDDLLTFFNEQKPKQNRLIVRPASNGIPGNPVIFSADYKDILIQNAEKEGYGSLINQMNPDLKIYSSSDPAYYTDIDTVEDYQLLF